MKVCHATITAYSEIDTHRSYDWVMEEKIYELNLLYMHLLTALANC